MTQAHNYQLVREPSRLIDFPALASLGLTAEDLGGLARQGFLAAERRRDWPCWKLRFRRGGRQVVRYVGGTDKAALVAEELKELQAARTHQRELNRLGSVARHMLRDQKAKLEPLLLACGFKFHGRAIRRLRRPANKL
jgi:hypothetical protein